jgi:hypothetical protein
MRSIYFNDPNGIALEASCWAHNPTGRAPTSDDIRYSDAEPVPAVRELLETGTLRALPRTRLVDAPTGDVYRLVDV